MPKIRMLIAHEIMGFKLSADAVPDLPANLAAALIEDGGGDPHPSAVAYAEGLGVALPAGFVAAMAALQPSAPKRSGKAASADPVEP